MDYDKDFEGEFFESTHGRIYARHHKGSGKGIIFLHGVGANTKAWSKLMGALAQGLDVYLIDLLGHGNSDAPNISYTIGLQAEALNEFIKGHNMQDPYIVGHSYGGWIAAYYAIYYGNVGGLVLVDSVGIKEFFDDIVDSGKRAEYNDDLLKRLLMRNGNRGYVMRSILENEYGDEQLEGRALGMISAKTLIIWGADDPTVNIKYGEMLHSRINGSIMEIVKGAGHNPHHSHFEDVGRLLLNFINQ